MKMHFRFCLETERFVKIVPMRFFPLVVVAVLLCCLAPASAWAQKLQCNPCNHNFGKVQVGNSSSYSVQLTNTGNKTLRISSKSEQGSAFSLGKFPLPVKVQPGASIQLPVIFTPTAQGYSDGILTLASNAPNSPLYMHVAGNGVHPNGRELGVTPATLNFGNVTVGSSASLQATLTASNAAVTISSDQSTSSEFAILGLNLPVTVPAGKSIPVTIQFTPNASGKASGKAGFISNAADSPTVEQLTGTGVAQGSHTVDLSWDAGDGKAVGYNVYRGSAKRGPFQMINTALDASTNYTDNTVVSGATYYYVATEVDAQGQESGYSNVGRAVIPNP
jgi:Abnormal spindle-like microcephaly-assoc'd, ASPM-SPD-2-Hydin